MKKKSKKIQKKAVSKFEKQKLGSFKLKLYTYREKIQMFFFKLHTKM